MCSFLHVNICVSSSRLETKIFAFGVLFELNKSCPSSIDGTASLNARACGWVWSKAYDDNFLAFVTLVRQTKFEGNVFPF